MYTFGFIIKALAWESCSHGFKFLKPFLVTSFLIALPKRVVMSVLCDQVAR